MQKASSLKQRYNTRPPFVKRWLLFFHVNSVKGVVLTFPSRVDNVRFESIKNFLLIV